MAEGRVVKKNVMHERLRTIWAQKKPTLIWSAFFFSSLPGIHNSLLQSHGTYIRLITECCNPFQGSISVIYQA